MHKLNTSRYISRKLVLEQKATGEGKSSFIFLSIVPYDSQIRFFAYLYNNGGTCKDNIKL